MVGPEDAGACPGRKPRLFPPPGPEPGGRDGRMIGATGGPGGGRGSCCLEPQEEGEEEEEESEEEESEEEEGATPPPQRLIQRYLEVTGGQLEPGLCHCSPLSGSQAGRPPRLCGDESDGKPPQGGGPGSPRPRMTNGDSSFLLGPGCQDLEAGGLPLPARPCPQSAPEGNGGGSFLRFPREPRCCRASSSRRMPGADCGGESPPDGTTPLEDPLRSCRLGAAEPGGSGSEAPPPAEPGAPQRGGITEQRTPGGAPTEPGFSFTDVNLNSRNTYEVSRRQSAPDYLAQAGLLLPPPASELGPAGAAAKARRSGGGGGGFADFFARYLIFVGDATEGAFGGRG